MKTKIIPLVVLATLMGATNTINAQEISSPSPVGVTAVATLDSSTSYFVGLQGLKVRSRPEETQKSLGFLNLNDRVKVINPNITYANNMVEVSIEKTYSQILTGRHFISREYLSSKKVDYKEFTDKYFAIVNVASETLRLYERVCMDNSCPHKMLMETEVVVGEDTDLPARESGKGKSVLGSYRITGWSKFYEDAGGHYPAWYKDGYPALPEVGDGGGGWLSKKVMPKDEKGKRHGTMRGAFGWFTAFVGPNAYNQWTHGTIGWGADKDAMIKRTKKTLINIVSDPRSSGCTRNDNEAIAVLRQYLKLGAPIVKIYAREAILDKDLRGYSNQPQEFNYILTKDSKSHIIQRDEVLKALNLDGNDVDALAGNIEKNGRDNILLDPKNPLNKILEVGTYEIDAYPDAVVYQPGEKLKSLERKTKRTGNVYGVASSKMQGTYYVDAGMLENYKHPSEKLEVSGFMDEVTPSFMSVKTLK